LYNHIYLRILRYENNIAPEKSEEKKEMLKETLEAKKGNPKTFQVLLLNNDKRQEVEVQDTERIDFFRIDEHLKRGGSVFITSKRSQKIATPKAKKRTLENSALRTVTAVYFENA
jgi:hypothetical protein